jgi:hypothetical protein
MRAILLDILRSILLVSDLCVVDPRKRPGAFDEDDEEDEKRKKRQKKLDLDKLEAEEKKLEAEQKKLEADVGPLVEAINALPEELKLVEALADVGTPIILPFPFAGAAHLRFALEKDDAGVMNFEFEPRAKLADFDVEVQKFLKGNTKALLLYGTIGWGKSHLLAAECLLLMRRGRRVVYLPDCKALREEPAEYVKKALALALTLKPLDVDDAFSSLAVCGDIDSLLQWKRDFLGSNEELVFFIGQTSALDATGKGEAYTDDAKIARDFLKKLTSGRQAVKESSANNQIEHDEADSQSRPPRFNCFGGLSPAEYLASRAYGFLDNLEGEQRKHVEDKTGRIPLYLNAFVSCLRKVADDEGDEDEGEDKEEEKGSNFDAAWSRFTREKGPALIRSNLEEFYDEINRKGKAAICLLSMATGCTQQMYSVKLYDARYFYQEEDGQCRCVCGLARDVAGDLLFERARDLWLRQIKPPSPEDNPIEHGFSAERASLACIVANGIELGGQRFVLSQDAMDRKPCVLVIRKGVLSFSVELFSPCFCSFRQ